MKKTFRLSALFAAATLSFGLATSAQADVVKIGFVGPITGPLTQYGDMVLEGMNTAIETVNDPVFSQKMIGDGFAIFPESQEIYAPVNGVSFESDNVLSRSKHKMSQMLN